MDIYQAEEFLKKMYPGKEIKMEFDETCHREINFVFTEGAAHGINHIAFNRVKANVDGFEPFYMDIMPHRICSSWNDLKKYIISRNEFYVHDNDLHVLADLQSLEDDHKDKWQYEQKIKETLDLSELTREQLLDKVKNYIDKRAVANA